MMQILVQNYAKKTCFTRTVTMHRSVCKIKLVFPSERKQLVIDVFQILFPESWWVDGCKFFCQSSAFRINQVAKIWMIWVCGKDSITFSLRFRLLYCPYSLTIEICEEINGRIYQSFLFRHYIDFIILYKFDSRFLKKKIKMSSFY